MCRCAGASGICQAISQDLEVHELRMFTICVHTNLVNNRSTTVDERIQTTGSVPEFRATGFFGRETILLEMDVQVLHVLSAFKYR